MTLNPFADPTTGGFDTTTCFRRAALLLQTGRNDPGGSRAEKNLNSHR